MMDAAVEGLNALTRTFGAEVRDILELMDVGEGERMSMLSLAKLLIQLEGTALRYRPDVVVDAVNTATAISYQDVYTASEIVSRDLTGCPLDVALGECRRECEAISADQLPLDDVSLGDSICTNGVCLTVIELPGDGYWADVSVETLDFTTLSELRQGSKVNLEKAILAKGLHSGNLVVVDAQLLLELLVLVEEVLALGHGGVQVVVDRRGPDTQLGADLVELLPGCVVARVFLQHEISLFTVHKRI